MRVRVFSNPFQSYSLVKISHKGMLCEIHIVYHRIALKLYHVLHLFKVKLYSCILKTLRELNLAIGEDGIFGKNLSRRLVKIFFKFGANLI